MKNKNEAGRTMEVDMRVPNPDPIGAWVTELTTDLRPVIGRFIMRHKTEKRIMDAVISTMGNELAHALALKVTADQLPEHVAQQALDLALHAVQENFKMRIVEAGEAYRAFQGVKTS